MLRVTCLLKTLLSNHITDSFNTHRTVYQDITRLMCVNFSLVLTRWTELILPLNGVTPSWRRRLLVSVNTVS